MYMFGAGNVYLTPQNVATPTPLKVGTLQEASFDMSFENKELYGNQQFPVMVARGKGKITGKAKSGEFKGSLISSILSGSTVVSGRRIGASESTSIPATTPYTYNTTHATNWVEDLGVINMVTGAPMTCVTGVPTTGQYAVAAGVYTFAAADTGIAIQVNYAYTDSSLTSDTIKYYNQLMGAQTIYQLSLYNTEPDGSMFGIKFTNVVFPKLSMNFKNDDFTMPDLDFSAFMNPSGEILEVYVPTL